MPQEYRIVSQSDEKSRNSISGRKQRAIAQAVVKGGGQLSASQVADAATKKIGDPEIEVKPTEVSAYLKAFKTHFPDKKLPGVKAGARGKRSMALATSGEMDDFLSNLED